MGIFSRIFQRGQEGGPSDAGSEDGNSMSDDTERIQREAPAPPPAPPPSFQVDEPPASSAPKLPGLTPAFAAASTSAPHTPAEPARSMWDWPGPQPRRNERAATGNSDESPQSAVPPEPRTPPRAGALPSVPRTQPTAEPTKPER